MTNYKREFENYRQLPFEEKRKLVLSLLQKIKKGSDTLERIHAYLSNNAEVDEADLQETFIAVLTGMKTADESGQIEAVAVLDELSTRLKAMKEREAAESQREKATMDVFV